MATDRPNAVPLRDRLPGYLAWFAVGLGVGLGVAFVIWLVGGAGLGEGLGYTYGGLGALLLLLGGGRGSGFGGGGSGPEAEDGQSGAKPDLLARRRRRLQRPPDPTDFWLVVAGFAFLGMGIGIASLFGG